MLLNSQTCLCFSILETVFPHHIFPLAFSLSTLLKKPSFPVLGISWPVSTLSLFQFPLRALHQVCLNGQNLMLFCFTNTRLSTVGPGRLCLSMAYLLVFVNTCRSQEAPEEMQKTLDIPSLWSLVSSRVIFCFTVSIASTKGLRSNLLCCWLAICNNWRTWTSSQADLSMWLARTFQYKMDHHIKKTWMMRWDHSFQLKHFTLN